MRNKFISDSNYSTDVLNKMYDNRDKAKRAFEYNGTIDSAIEYEKNSIITEYISGMNKAIKALPEEKQRTGRAFLLKTLNQWNYDNTASQSNMLSRLEDSDVSLDIIFDDLPSSALEWTVNKQKVVYQMSPQEYYEYFNRYLAEIENARNSKGSFSVESWAEAKEEVKEKMSDYKKGELKDRYLSKAIPKE